MSRTLTPPTPRPIATATATRVRFTAAADDPLRRYLDPRPAVAVVGAATVVPAPAAWPEPVDTLDVLTSADRRPLAADDWLARPDHPDAPLPITIPLAGGRLRWRPGRAVVEGPVDDAEAVTAALADFAFYEGELRRLELALPEFERAAADDAAFAYQIDGRAGERWPRFGRTMEQLATLRLTFARLEPRLGRPSPSLPPAGRRTFARLAARAGVEDRLVGVSDRLEACEDLYEGAVDRVTDHRWWRRGHRLEAVIVVLLAVEGVQLAAELVLHLLQLRGR